jgi:hypothetical protein
MVNSKRKLSNLEAFTDLAEESPAIPVEAIQVGNHSLTEEEREERERLEKIVEKSFYSAGKALKDLREKKLYRDQYPTFEEYCRVRFGFQRRHPYQLINAAAVVDNLIEMCANSAQNLEPEKENLTIPLPTTEFQVRSLTGLSPIQQGEVWRKAVEEAGDQVPSARIVKDVVQRISERIKAPNPYRVGDICQILVKENPDLRGRGGEWCVVVEVFNFSCLVKAWDGELQVHVQNLKDLEYSIQQRKKVRSLCDRLNKLSKFYKEKTVRALLKQFGKSTSPYLLPVEEDVLIFLEMRLDSHS